VRSVFAPDDAAVDLVWKDGHLTLRPRQSSGDVTPAGEYQSSNDASSAASLGIVPGQVSTQNLPAAGTKKQVVTTHPAKNSTNSTTSKNTLESRWPPNNFPTFVSGLGNSVNIIQADTPWDGGLIQTIDGFFTVPQSFSATFSQTGSSSFGAALQVAGLESVIDNPAGVTVFGTPNAAFQAAVGHIWNPHELARILSNQIIPNFEGYLPLLQDGQVLTTLAGTTVTVHIIDGQYFIDDALIVSSDLITSNGVSHTLDKLLEPPCWERRAAFRRRNLKSE